MAVVVVVLLHLYLYRRLVHDVARTRRWRRLGLVVLVLLALSTLGAFALRRVLPISPTTAPQLDWVGYVWLVIGLYAALVLVVLELPRLVLTRDTEPSRRRALSRVFAGVAGLIALGTVGF